MNGKEKKIYNLEERTLAFTKQVISFVREIPMTIANREIAKQLVRSAGSIGANYREANDSLGKKDFLMRMRICRKEAKETVYWLELVETAGLTVKQNALLSEATELMKICGSIIRNSQV